MTTNMFYQVWDVRNSIPRVLDTTDTRDAVRTSRRQIFRKNRALTSQDVRLVQLQYTDDGSPGSVRFIR